VERNYSDLIEKSLDVARLELLHLLAYQADSIRIPLYIVGGVVRDLMMSRTVNDLDLVVEGDAAVLGNALLKKFGGRVIFHSRFGTATWFLNEVTFKRLNVPALHSSALPASLDLISARSESYQRPGMLPTVTRSTIEDDLRRRDFTINAMAIRLDGYHFGELFDPLGGQADLERSLIRVLHGKSFVDDPTRIFRAIRYAVRYGFRIEPETFALINDEARIVMSQLSGERLRHEFDLFFEESDPSGILGRVAEMELLEPVHPSLLIADCHLPPLEPPGADFGEFVVPDSLSFRKTLGWMLCLLNSPEDDIELIAQRLAFPALLTKSARAASHLSKDLSSKDWKPSQWTFHLDELPPLAVYAVYLAKREQALGDYLSKWRHIKPYTTGDDLVKRGLEPGPKYKEILSRLRAAWLDGLVKTEEDEIFMRNRLLMSGGVP
jgi:tRNA nucleotidyltransferase (CCA-adding enzyme)